MILCLSYIPDIIKNRIYKIYGWELRLIGTKLFIKISSVSNISQTDFINLLDYSENVLKCSDIIIYFDKSIINMIRVFMCYGFTICSKDIALDIKDIYLDTLNMVFMKYIF